MNCWNINGVWGRQSPRCEKLKQVVHCHNCEVYSNSGQLVFERKLDDRYLSQWTEKLLEIPSSHHVRRDTDIVFRIATEWLSIPTMYFSEITLPRTIRTIPHRSGKVILGISNISGSVRLVCSLAYLLGLEGDINSASESYINTRHMVVSYKGECFVFPVCEIAGFFNYLDQELQPAPSTLERKTNQIIKGIFTIGDRNIASLDMSKLYKALGVAVRE